MYSTGVIRTTALVRGQFNQWYLFNDISDGQQLLCGVSCLRQWGIIIVTSHY